MYSDNSHESQKTRIAVFSRHVAQLIFTVSARNCRAIPKSRAMDVSTGVFVWTTTFLLSPVRFRLVGKPGDPRFSFSPR